MTQEKLKQLMEQSLDSIELAMAQLKTVVIEYADHNEPLDLYGLDGGELERKLDGLGFTNGWVIDRLAHRTEKSRGSVLRKIRIAQGYNR